MGDGVVESRGSKENIGGDPLFSRGGEVAGLPLRSRPHSSLLSHSARTCALQSSWATCLATGELWGSGAL